MLHSRIILYLIVVTVVKVSYCADVSIGGLFHTRLEEFGDAFKQAIDDVNERGTLGDHQLVGVLELVPEMNPFQAGRGACRLLAGGVAGVFGPHSPSTAVHVQSICDTKEVPHIETRWDWQQPRGGCSINLHPHPSTLTQALEDVIAAWGWKTFSILYQDEYSLASMASLLRKENEYSIVLRQLEKDGNYREVLKDIQRSACFSVVIDCSREILFDVLKQAQQVGILVAEYSYIITNLDLQSVELETFMYSGSNITGFRMNQYDPEEPLLLGSALMHDSVVLFSHALSMMSDTNITDLQPLNCSGVDSWPHGYTLINFMKSIEFTGLTGVVKFDYEGFRSQVELILVELLENKGLVDIGKWNSSLGLNLTRVPLPPEPTIDDSLANKTFIVMISLTTNPYAMLKESTQTLYGNARFEGFAIDLIQELSSLLGFNYTFVVQEKGTTGSEQPDGSWDGMLGKVIRGEAHLAITDLTITQERGKVVDFTMPFMTLGIQVLYKKPTQEPPKMFSFMDPFSKEVWMYMLAAYIIVSVLLFVMARISPYEWTNPYPCIEDPEVLENQFSLRNSLWFTIGSLLQQGSEIAPIAVSTRMVAGIWWFFTLIMVSSYTANLAAFLVVKSPLIVFEHVNQLPDNDKGITYGAKKEGSTAKFFMNSKHPVYGKMGEYMLENQDEVLPLSNDEGVRWVKEKNYAFLMESTAIEYTVQRECGVASVGGLLDSKGYGIAMQKDAPYRNALNTAVLTLQESGRLTILKDKWWKEKRGGGKCTDTPEAGSDNGSLGLANVGGVFVVLVGGVLIACFLTVFELIWSIFKLTRSEDVTFKDELIKELKFVAAFSGSTKPSRNFEHGSDGDSEGEGDEQPFQPQIERFNGWFENTEKKTPLP